jgi:hypothetical protein
MGNSANRSLGVAFVQSCRDCPQLVGARPASLSPVERVHQTRAALLLGCSFRPRAPPNGAQGMRFF